jgi:hypothetical protein
MKVLDLRCANGHGFEGWFASDEAFMDQNERTLIECPMCDDVRITRLPSAPRLNLSGARPAPQASPNEVANTPVQQVMPGSAMQLQWLKAVRHMIDHTEDVGERFALEARRIHYGEIEARGIRGQASVDERRALQEEGIEIMSLPVPAALKGPLQ